MTDASATTTTAAATAIANPGGDIEVDPNLLEGDGSDYEGSEYETSTASLSSSVHEYIFENGRRYHTYFGVEKSLLPADEKEQDRLDLNHEILLQTLEGQLHLAPLENPQRILDVGTGTGIWAIDMADQYPSAKVVGIDITPIQPKWVPPNCSFELDDADREWTYKDHVFDFIHFRNVSQGISDWPKVLSEAYRCLQPGGYIELADSGQMVYSDDGTVGEACLRFFENLVEALTKISRPPVLDGELQKRLETAGFEDVNAVAIKQPWGPWAKSRRQKQIGAMNMLQAETAFHAYGVAAFTRILGMDAEKADTVCREGYRDVLNKNSHMYGLHYVAYGRKPLLGQE